MKFPRPELLMHPNIPKPLHGVNPRSILGNDWWDRVRKIAYEQNDYRCWACNIHKNDAAYFPHLEAHEAYNINYSSGRVELKEIVALCHSCHNFIHSGRMMHLYNKKDMSMDKMKSILRRGFSILEANELKPYYATALMWMLIEGYDIIDAWLILDEKGLVPQDRPLCKWNEWHLCIDGKSYYSQFANSKEWEKAYE